MLKVAKWSLPALAFAVVVALAGMRAGAQEGGGAAAAKGKVTGIITMEDGSPAANVTVRLIVPMARDKKAEKDKSEGDAAKPAPQAADEGAKPAEGKKPGEGQKPAEGEKPAKPERAKPVAETKTDAAGKFELEAPAGKYTVMANLRGQGRVQKTIDLKAGKTEDVGTLVLKRQPAKKEKEAAPAT
jgi:hypothetical protein